MTPSDIVFYHSGGATNNDPELDLGGDVSTYVVGSNLFDDVSREQVRYGNYVDYRCIYIYNTNLTDTLFDSILYIDSERVGGSYLELGVSLQNEIQKLIFTGTPAEGNNITLVVDGQQVTVDYYLNTTQWQGDMQTKIRGIDNLQDVIVEVGGTVPNVTFTVNFIGSACCRQFALTGYTSNNLLNTTFTAIEQQAGGPIKTTSPTIATKIQTPTGVQFSYPLLGSPIQLGNLRPGEGFPLWIQRTTPMGSLAKIDDNLTIMLTGAGS
jgi:hypothetical protein